jgi:hypothetical protein
MQFLLTGSSGFGCEDLPGGRCARQTEARGDLGLQKGGCFADGWTGDGQRQIIETCFLGRDIPPLRVNTTETLLYCWAMDDSPAGSWCGVTL